MVGANHSQVMDGRWFDERQLSASISTGNEKYKKSSDRSIGLDGDEDEDDEESGRLDKFGKWLETAK